MARGTKGGELRRSLLVGGIATAGLLVGVWLFLQYHESRQTEIAGYATARVLAEQVEMQRRIYTQEVVPRARRAGMEVDISFEHTANTLPAPVTLVNLVGQAVAAKLPGARIRLFSHFPFGGKAADLDGFEIDALASFAKGETESYFRTETKGGHNMVRYAVADVMTQECVNCHNGHPLSPRRDWKVGDVRGAVEVSLPMNELAAMMRAEQLSFGRLLLGGLALFALAVAVFVRHDLNRARRERAALIDPITGLPTRRAAEEAIATEVQRARRYGHPVSFVMLDLDHFKQINDKFGHGEGDRILAEVGRALTSGLRDFDLAARWGGEEFLIVLPSVNAEGGRAMAERIRVAVHAITGDAAPITISAGVAELADGETTDRAIARADERLYQAKQSGRDRVC